MVLPFVEAVVAMHELGITRNIVAIVDERARGRDVKRVTLEIGQLTAIVPDAIRYCFDVCAKGTSLENAELQIEEISGRGECELCGKEVPMGLFARRCDCGSAQLHCIAGEELKIKEMEIH